MPRELITIQVGQCGNQIGYRFWDLAFKEHAKYNHSKKYDDALSSFFRNTNEKSNLKVGSDLQNLKARAIIVDMEEGVINQIMKSELGELFDQRQFINDVSGAGNNWAHGFYEYGSKHKTLLVDKIGKAVQECDSLQSFFLMHSLGGGTGSGLGTFILGLLQEYYPDIFRFTASVFPPQQDDVITSPYNSIFSLYELMKHADCVLPIDNQALINIVNEVQNITKSKFKNQQVAKGSKITDMQEKKKQKPYDKMNNIIAHLLSNLTCSMRFQGTLNVDFNEITMNLVPYPDLHFLISSIAPLYNITDPRLQPRRLDEIFNDVYSPDHQLIECNPKSYTYLAMGLILRGNVSFSDVNRNIKQLRDKKDLRFVYWNSEGFKYGICNTPPINQPYSALCLANNTCIKQTFKKMKDRYMKLYKKELYAHHYQNYGMQKLHFTQSIGAVSDIIMKYDELEKLEPPSKPVKRLKPLLL